MGGEKIPWEVKLRHTYVMVHASGHPGDVSRFHKRHAITSGNTDTQIMAIVVAFL